MAGSALAADLPSRKAPVAPPPPPPLWTGYHVGVNIGGGWGAGNGNGNAYNLLGMNGGYTNNLNGGSALGGIQVGYDYQFGGLGLGGMGIVAGVETDFQGSGLYGKQNSVISVPTAVGPFAANTPYTYSSLDRLDYFGTVRGRLGITVTPTLLVYGTGGFTYGFVYRGVSGYSGSYSSALQTGWNAGGGVEWMFMPNWSTKVEYLYSDISGGNNNGAWGNWGTGLNNINNHTRWNTVRAGLNYHFNWAATPIVAAF